MAPSEHQVDLISARRQADYRDRRDLAPDAHHAPRQPGTWLARERGQRGLCGEDQRRGSGANSN